jgi:UDP-N-acetylmuramoylalanine--D-glutamate ligase
MSTFPATLFGRRRYAVVGLGRNGLPAAQALAAMGASVTVWDDRADARDAAARAGLTVRDPVADSFEADALVLSPGIPHRLPAPHPAATRALAAGVPILSDAELLFQAVRAAGSRARFVGITGTNGKSTTTALLAHMLTSAGIPVAAGGNLGTAALALPLLPDHGVYVLEMSSYMLERLATLRFDAAALLNLTPDHLDRHGDMAGYAAAKRAIFARQTPADLAVIGPDIDADGIDARLVRLDAEPPLIDAPGLPGRHNAQNAAAAAALARHLGLSDAAIRRATENFPGLAHRQQRVATIGGTLFVNDSKATNADAAARAIGCYDRIGWIAGGIAKAGGIEDLAPLFGRIAQAWLIGRDAPLLAATLAAHRVPHAIVDTLEAAVPAAAAAGLPVVLLSPACASFDQFAGFEARGDRFMQLVKELPATQEAEAA